MLNINIFTKELVPNEETRQLIALCGFALMFCVVLFTGWSDLTMALILGCGCVMQYTDYKITREKRELLEKIRNLEFTLKYMKKS